MLQSRTTKRFLFPLIDGAALYSMVPIWAQSRLWPAIVLKIRKCSQGRSSGLYFELKSQRSLCVLASCTWFRKFLWASTQKAIMVEVWFQLVRNAEAYIRRVRMRADYVERGRRSPLRFNCFRFPAFEVVLESVIEFCYVCPRKKFFRGLVYGLFSFSFTMF